ncbi:ion channel [Enterococcus sp. LJL98]
MHQQLVLEEKFSKKQIFYYGGMFLLILLSIINFFIDSRYSQTVDFIILAIFFLDTCYRVIQSEHRWKYVFTHPLEIIALIPISASFRSVRLIPLIIQVLRFTTIGKRYLLPAIHVLNQTILGRFFWYFVLLVFVVPLPLLWYEPGMKNYGTLMWWTIETVTTVGYGDIAIKTTIGRVIAVILMVMGVGLIGMISSTLMQLMTRPEPIAAKLDEIALMEEVPKPAKTKQPPKKPSATALKLTDIQQLQQLLEKEKQQLLKQQTAAKKKEE